MFQDMTRQFGDSLSSVRELVEAQTRLLERLTELQVACARSCVETTLKQTRQLPACHSAQELIELQQQYVHQMEELLREASNNNFKVLREAREEMEAIAQSSFDAFASGRKD